MAFQEYLERIVRGVAGKDRPLDLQTLKNLADNAAPDERPLGPAGDSSQSSDFDGVDEKFSIKPLQDNITHYSGEFSHWNFSMRIKDWIDKTVPDRGSNQQLKSPTSFKEYYRAEELRSPSNTISLLALLPPRPIAEFLSQSFFKHATVNYFFVERAWYNANLELAYDDPQIFSRRGVSIICILFTVLAIGTQFAYLESLGDDAGSSHNQAAAAEKFSEDSIGMVFYQQACRLLPDVITVSSLESVQACLLLGMYTLPVDPSGLSYTYLNLAIKLAIQNGMHRKYPGEGLETHIRETRNRVWWTAYTIEKRIGIFHGRPMSIASTDIDADLPTDHFNVWPSTSISQTKHLLATLELNQRLGQISQEISFLRKQPKNEMSDSLGKLVRLQNELRSWWNSLPDNVFCKNPGLQSTISRNDMHLKLEYCLVRMFVGRIFILPHEGGRNSASPSTSATEPSGAASRKRRLRAVLVTDCIEAALAVIDTCRALHRSIGLARASYTEFSACRAALLVITAQCLYNRENAYKKALRDGLAMLKEMSAGSESAHSDFSLIEAFERAIAKINSATPAPMPSNSESEYARFKRWEQLWKNDTSLMDMMNEQAQSEQVPLPTVNFGLGGTEDVSRQGTMPSSSTTTFFGMDGNFASFPQNLDDLSAFFGNDFGMGLDVE
ncbi:transcriptional regulatory protein [Paramyrothecium foliicola]|nr:transcriptional regulatory protein [Paramyrothecium foliicola]